MQPLRPFFTFHAFKTVDGVWVYLVEEDYKALKASGIEPECLTKKELDLYLTLLKA